MILASASPASLLLGIAAVAAYAVPAAVASFVRSQISRVALMIAWLFHGLTLVVTLFGPTPQFGFAPALSITAWLVLTVYGIEIRVFPQLRGRWILAILGAATVVLSLVFPGKPLHVSASPLLPLHLALGIASYGLFAAAVVHAWLMTRAEKQIRLASDEGGGVPLLTLERLTFRFVVAGFVLLTATLLAGWFFGERLYGPGKPWQWDHKTILSLLAWVTFATLLIGRTRFGWRGKRAVRFLYVGTALLLLAYVGSRFVLEVLLGRMS